MPFVKRSWNTKTPNPRVHPSLVESYRDPKTGRPKHRTLCNLSGLPEEMVELIDKSCKGKELVDVEEVKVVQGDTLRGGGTLAVWRAFQGEGFDEVLGDLKPAKRQSVLAMIIQRILHPGSKLSLRRQFQDTLLARVWPAQRLDEDELYQVMDELHERFYEVQERLAERREKSPLLCLYDLTSSYFEGSQAEDGAYGHSRDKRWDRYQIVIGLVCDEQGVPVAIEVWPGNTADSTTVTERVRHLRERFGIERAAFVGDSAMYTQANIEALEEAGFDYIMRLDFRSERARLEELAPVQLGLFDQQGIAEWSEDGRRYVGCLSPAKKERARRRRERGITRAEQELSALAETAAKGRYYSWTRLREKSNRILESCGVKDLFKVDISYLSESEDPGSPEGKARLKLSFAPREEAILRREQLEGVYVLSTSLDETSRQAEQVDQEYRKLQQVERSFKHIKSYLRLRPIYHYLQRRVRAHVLICFLAYYLVKKLELELRAKGVNQEVEPLLRHWDTLQLGQVTLQVNGKTIRHEWNWALGENGEAIKQQIQHAGYWQSIDTYRRSLVKAISA